MKNKIITGIIAIVAAIVLPFLVVPMYIADQTATAMVPVVAAEIKEGTVITESMIKSVETGTYGMNASVLRSGTDILGHVAAETLHEGEMFRTDTVLTADAYEALHSTDNLLAPGYCLVSVKLGDAAAAVCSQLRKGDLADAYQTIENEDRSITTQRVLQNMLVFDVYNQALTSLNEVEETMKKAKDSGSNDTFDMRPAYVTIYCKQSEAAVLINLEKSNTLHLTYNGVRGE